MCSLSWKTDWSISTSSRHKCRTLQGIGSCIWASKVRCNTSINTNVHVWLPDRIWLPFNQTDTDVPFTETFSRLPGAGEGCDSCVELYFQYVHRASGQTRTVSTSNDSNGYEHVEERFWVGQEDFGDKAFAIIWVIQWLVSVNSVVRQRTIHIMVWEPQDIMYPLNPSDLPVATLIPHSYVARRLQDVLSWTIKSGGLKFTKCYEHVHTGSFCTPFSLVRYHLKLYIVLPLWCHHCMSVSRNSFFFDWIRSSEKFHRDMCTHWKAYSQGFLISACSAATAGQDTHTSHTKLRIWLSTCPHTCTRYTSIYHTHGVFYCCWCFAVIPFFYPACHQRECQQQSIGMGKWWKIFTLRCCMKWISAVHLSMECLASG